MLNSVLNTAVIEKETTCDFEKAINHFHQAHNEEAIKHFELCLQVDGLKYQSQFYMGISYRNLDNYEMAQKLLKSIIGKDDNINYYLEYAYTFEKSGKIADAKEVYLQTTQKYPQNFPARLGLARMHHWLGDIDQSIKQYTALKKDHPEKIEVNLGLAFALLSDRKLNQSRQLFDAILSIDKDNKSAQEGINMLSKVKNHNITVSSSSVSFGDNTTKTQKIAFISTPDFSLKWGGHLTHYQQPIDSFFIEAVSTNRFVLNEFSIFAIYKSSSNNELLGEYVLQDLFRNDHLHKIKLEDYYTFENKNQISLGVTQSFINSELINTLTTFGFSIKPKDKLEVIGRFYYSSDKQLFDSQSISTSIIKTTKNDNVIQLGASLNRFQGELSTTTFGKISWKLNKDFTMTVNAARNTKNQYTQYSLGLGYDF